MGGRGGGMDMEALVNQSSRGVVKITPLAKSFSHLFDERTVYQMKQMGGMDDLGAQMKDMEENGNLEDLDDDDDDDDLDDLPELEASSQYYQRNAIHINAGFDSRRQKGDAAQQHCATWILHHNPGNTTCNKFITCNNFF